MVLLNRLAIVSLSSAHDAILISVHPKTGQPITLQIHEFQNLHFTSHSTVIQLSYLSAETKTVSYWLLLQRL